MLDGEVVLTKMKLFSNFNDRLLIADDSASTISAASVFEQDITEPSKTPKLNSRFDEKHPMEAGTDYLPNIFTDSQLPRLYKFESEDSGVELPSGANSPSSPTGSEQSFVVHSRESSCDSCNSNSDPTALTDELVTYAQSSEIKQAEDSVDNNLSTAAETLDDVFIHSQELSSSGVTVELHIGEEVDRDQRGASGISPEGDEMSGQVTENSTGTERTCLERMGQFGNQSSAGACDDMTGSDFEPEPVWRSTTSDSLEEYMDECCRLSVVSRHSR